MPEPALAALFRAKRVLVIGCGGSGKSTFARQLAPRLGLPITHLDALFWHPGWVPTADRDWDVIIEALVAEPRWLIDGNYSRTLPLRLSRADVVIWFDLPAATCLWRALRRGLRGHKEVRPDMAPDCPEHVNLDFLRWIAGFRRRTRPRLLKMRSRAPATQTWITLSSSAAASRLAAALRTP